jgi:transposase
VSAVDPVEQRATVLALRVTAARMLAAYQQARELEQGLRALVKAMAPVLLAQPDVGPITTTQVLISWSHPGRLRSEAAFAMLAGVAPIEASSGRVVHHRLNRGGDRQLNRALHAIALVRGTCHEPTRRHVARRIGEGNSEREIRRCASARSRGGCSGCLRAPPRQTGAGRERWRMALPGERRGPGDRHSLR